MINISNYNLGNYYIPEEVHGGICVDIGANVGCFFETFNNIFSKIHFYEPYKPCFDICIEKSKNFLNVTGFNECVSDSISVKEIVSHYNQDSGSNAIKGNTINEHWNRVIGTTNSVDFDTVLSRIGGKIDYLKCDCETSEYNIFINKDLSSINIIAMELHWQMGEKKYYELLGHIDKTHDIIYGMNPVPFGEYNQELVFKRK